MRFKFVDSDIHKATIDSRDCCAYTTKFSVFISLLTATFESLQCKKFKVLRFQDRSRYRNAKMLSDTYVAFLISSTIETDIYQLTTQSRVFPKN